jgi:diguanylate cyclase (GGDEF)-like protein
MNRIIPGCLILAAGAIVYIIGGSVGDILVPVSFITAAVWFFASNRKWIKKNPGNHSEYEDALSRQQPVTGDVQKENSEVTIAALGTDYRRLQWKETEQTVDSILDNFINVIQSKLNAHTVAVLFPTPDNGYSIRRFTSKSENINDKAVIYPGVGVIGSFLKDGLRQLNLHEIVTDSMTLYYYKKDAGIRSLMASPVTGGNAERGVVIVDSTEVHRFSDEDHSYLSSMAALIGQTVYATYLSTEYKLEHHRIVAMSSIEKEFFRNLSIDSILDKILEIIPFAISCDRLTISLTGTDAGTAVIRRAWGLNSENFSELTFSIQEKTLAGLVYSKNICLFRNFAGNRYETRYNDGEPVSHELSSFIAFPIGVDKCSGLIMLESLRRDAFTESSRDLLSRLATSAGLAIEKLRILEKANTMATHDGLTGLINHREFQSLLKDEITRSIRYNDPMSLVICDIDFFKKVNDTYGHQFGDTVLREVSNRLKENVREGVDLVARYGGEEFALVLVKTDAERAAETVERIRQQVEQVKIKSPRGENMNVTMSFGIAVFPQHAKLIDALIQKADKALYRAKGNGRNRVEMF